MTPKLLELIGRWARPQLRFEERLSGAYRLVGARGEDRERPLRLALMATSDPCAPLARFQVQEGVVQAPGLLDVRLSGGEITIQSAKVGWLLAYALRAFSEADSDLWILGEKEIAARDLYAGFTTLRGALVDKARDEKVAELCLRFDARGDVGWWLRSLNLAAGGPLARPRA